MPEKSSVNGFLMGLFGFKRAKGVPIPVPEPTAVNNPPATAAVNPAPRQTEAYLKRKKGRKTHRDSLGDLERIVAYIEAKGEVTPGEIERELGMSRSTLTYNLKRIMGHSTGAHRGRKYISGVSHYFFPKLLGERRLERLGDGRNVRYRLSSKLGE